jgi:AraC-like DNA-binding protein
MEIIFIIGMGLAFFFQILLLQKKGKSASDRILAVWMFVIGLHLFSAYATIQGLHFQWPFFIFIFIPFPMLHGPFLLLYLMSLTRSGKKVRWYDFLHFLPYCLGMIPYFRILNKSGIDAIVQLEDWGFGEIPWSFIMVGFGTQFSGIIYAVISYVLLQQHQKRIKNHFSYEEQVSLDWLRYLIFGIGFIFVVVIISVLFEETFGLLSPEGRGFMIFTAVTFFVVFIGSFGIRQESIFSDTPSLSEKTDNLNLSEKDVERYQRSGLKKEDIDHYFQQLLVYMEEEKPFLESRLSLNQLAAYLDMSPNHLSQVINEKSNQNFYQFVNSYRISTFQNKLKDPSNEHLTLLAIALDCGFNSKSSFNHIFKKMTGQTPSQYQKTILGQA